MNKLVWSEEYSVGAAKLDNQHKKIFKLMNVLIDAGEANVTPEEINDALTQMTQYACTHFASEEEYMASIGFPNIKSHELEHQEFSVRTTEFCLELMSGDFEVNRNIINYLRNWWVDHILNKDMAFRKFAEEKRASA